VIALLLVLGFSFLFFLRLALVAAGLHSVDQLLRLS
jgi:hypothetical protein